MANNNSKTSALARASTLLVIVLMGTVFWQSGRVSDLEARLETLESRPAPVSQPAPTTATVPAPGEEGLPVDAAQATGGLPPSFGSLVRQLSPAVVSIAAKADAGSLRSAPNFGQARPALGSGFVIDPSGIVITNHHVIEGSSDIEVIFTDGTSLEAEIVGQDPETDIAVLKISPDGNLPYVNFGNSDGAQKGDWAIAIGNPFGLGGSVSAGIISAFGRGSMMAGGRSGLYDSFIQTDLAINKGNSGGPLFNMAGEVIGINSAILSPSGGSIGISFSIPSNRAKIVVDQLRQYGRPVRGWLGVQIQDLDDSIAESLDRPNKKGVFVSGVLENQPADAGGMKAKDVIIAYNGEEVADTRDFLWQVARSPVGRSVKIDVWRDGDVVELSVVVGEREERFETARVEDERLVIDGIMISALNKDIRQQFDVDDDVEGVIVLQIEEGAPAADSNLRPGDVVVEVRDKDIKDPAELRDAFEKAKEEGRSSVLVRVMRQGNLRFEGVPLAADE